MSILIKGMDMPKSCGQCPCRQIFGDKVLCGITGDDIYELHICHMVEVPTPHGDLIDADVLADRILDMWKSKLITNTKYNTFNDIIDCQPIIIERESKT